METMTTRVIIALIVLLQWGHRLSAMETADSLAAVEGEGEASMGPPPFGDGNR